MPDKEPLLASLSIARPRLVACKDVEAGVEFTYVPPADFFVQRKRKSPGSGIGSDEFVDLLGPMACVQEKLAALSTDTGVEDTAASKPKAKAKAKSKALRDIEHLLK
jgi:hypothetical protein